MELTIAIILSTVEMVQLTTIYVYTNSKIIVASSIGKLSSSLLKCMVKELYFIYPLINVLTYKNP
jgi:hypothetical protein